MAIALKQRPSIQCRDLTKRFIIDEKAPLWRLLANTRGLKAFEALHKITLEVPAGQFVGLLGRNGAGKSTLLRTVGGIYTPNHGFVVVNGELSALYELGITGNDQLTGREFAHRWFDVFDTGDESRSDLIEEAADFSELAEAFDRPIRSYSTGMRSRLYFALATARKAQIYVIDEVLSVGDEYFQNKCWRRIRQRLNDGGSGLIATHDWSAILKLCQTSHLIERGRIVASGPSATIVRKYLDTEEQQFSKVAAFQDAGHLQLEGRSQTDFTVEFCIDVKEAGRVFFGAAIETFMVGFGWEHVLHAEPTLVATDSGRHRLTCTFPDLPLPAGDYSLAVYLMHEDEDGARTVTDSRSWTTANGIPLKVSGPAGRAAVRWPVRVASEINA
jgi:ABC-type polysaccharide/polyol phosphate transport system, ATPase component